MKLFLIRYPGSKAKLYSHIASLLPLGITCPLWRAPISNYCEPFVGSGAVCWQIFEPFARFAGPRPDIILNDVDPYIAHLWRVVRDTPDALKALIRARTPTVADFFAFKEQDGDDGIDPVEAAYRKLVLHNTSVSGYGAMSGSVIGGRDQRHPEYHHLSRWNARRFCKNIDRVHAIVTSYKTQVFSGDFEPVLDQLDAGSVCYLDPPYYVQGKALYKYNMDDAAHARLASVLSKAKYRFVLSYDSHSRIRELYTGMRVTPFSMVPTCSVQRGGERRKNEELLITNF